MNEISQFARGKHRFVITAGESCMIYSVTLSVNVEIRCGAETSEAKLPIFEITQGDHVWNTLVADAERDGVFNLRPCVPYLQYCAEEFCCTHPAPLRFGSKKKARKFSENVIRRPVSLRGSVYAVPYPGTGLRQ